MIDQSASHVCGFAEPLSYVFSPQVIEGKEQILT